MWVCGGGRGGLGQEGRSGSSPSHNSKGDQETMSKIAPLSTSSDVEEAVEVEASLVADFDSLYTIVASGVAFTVRRSEIDGVHVICDDLDCYWVFVRDVLNRRTPFGHSHYTDQKSADVVAGMIVAFKANGEMFCGEGERRERFVFPGPPDGRSSIEIAHGCTPTSTCGRCLLGCLCACLLA